MGRTYNNKKVQSLHVFISCIIKTGEKTYTKMQLIYMYRYKRENEIYLTKVSDLKNAPIAFCISLLDSKWNKSS